MELREFDQEPATHSIVTVESLEPGMIDRVWSGDFFAYRWIVNGEEGGIAVRASAKALRRSYPGWDITDSWLNARIYVTTLGSGVAVEVDRFSLDTHALSELPPDVRWLPVVLR